MSIPGPYVSLHGSRLGLTPDGLVFDGQLVGPGDVVTLHSNTTANETTAPVAWSGGEALWEPTGVWDGATIILQWCASEGDVFSMIDWDGGWNGTATVVVGASMRILPGFIRVKIEDAGAGTSLSSTIQRTGS